MSQCGYILELLHQNISIKKLCLFFSFQAVCPKATFFIWMFVLRSDSIAQAFCDDWVLFFILNYGNHEVQSWRDRVCGFLLVTCQFRLWKQGVWTIVSDLSAGKEANCGLLGFEFKILTVYVCLTCYKFCHKMANS